MASYRTTLITYIDVLGFERMIESWKPDRLVEVLRVLRKSTTPDPELGERLEMRCLSFSDLVVRTTHVDSKHNKASPDGLLWHELCAVAHAQIQLMRNGVMIRGGITVNDLYIDDNSVFGPGLVDAYKLESHLAVYPRIVVHPLVWKYYDSAPLLKSQLHDHEEEKREYIRPIVKKDMDGLWFVDYLHSSFWDDRVEGHVKFLEHHKQVILSAQDTLRGLDACAAKYIWLAHYHNAAVREHLVDVHSPWEERLASCQIQSAESDLVQDI